MAGRVDDGAVVIILAYDGGEAEGRGAGRREDVRQQPENSKAVAARRPWWRQRRGLLYASSAHDQGKTKGLRCRGGREEEGESREKKVLRGGTGAPVGRRARGRRGRRRRSRSSVVASI